MTRYTQLTRITAIAVAALALSACNSTGDPETNITSDPATATTAAPPTADASPSKTESVADQRARLASEAIANFWAKQDQLAANPYESLTELSSVARGQALAQWQRNLTVMRGDGVKQVGSVMVEASPGVLTEKTDLYEVTACIDVSKVNVVDDEGKSVVPADRPPRTQYNYKVERDGDNFYLVEDRLNGKPC